jgi:hypothetical protein
VFIVNLITYCRRPVCCYNLYLYHGLDRRHPLDLVMEEKGVRPVVFLVVLLSYILTGKNP